MLQETREYFWGLIKGLKPSFISKKPTFHFISIHYIIIVGCTFLASILLIAGSKGNMAYIDAFLFAAGANSQAGLNPIDVNKLNTFQQIILYIFPLLTNPITLHSCVVFLRLYWFEKRFQRLVRDARSRRASISKSRSHAKTDADRAERGVNGRRITILRGSGKKASLNVDGTVLVGSAYHHHPTHPGLSAEAGPSTHPRPSSSEMESSDDHAADAPPGVHAPDRSSTAQISFAAVVKKSDGMGLARTKFGPHEEHEAQIPLSPSTSQDDEILRIPGPREAEQGIGPRRIAEGTAPEGDDGENRAGPDGDASEGNGSEATRGEANGSATPPSRRKGKEPVRGHSAIQIEEPEQPWKEDIGAEARAIGNVFSALRFRRPRFLTKNRFHHVKDGDGDDGDDSQDSPDGLSWKAVRSKTMQNIKTALSQPEANDAPYLSWTPTMGRNSQFLDLTLEQREELGGIEYRSLRTLLFILVAYFWGFHLLGLFCMLGFIKTQESYSETVSSFGVSPTWWAFWTSNFSFMDVGFSLTPDSMASFKSSAYVLMILWFLIIIGNTGFPIMLRAIIWIFSKIVPQDTGLWQELRFLLDHPRRCFTLLFPSSATWWLFWILVILNGLDLIFFIILDLHNEVVVSLPVNIRVVNGLFLAACTRTAGFATVSISALHPAVQTSYMIMMYISVLPIAISIRRTNVYEEKSLGVYHEPEELDDSQTKAMAYVGAHLRRQLSFDLWYVVLGVFILAITEAKQIDDGKFDMWSIMFEIVSAYGTVGLSLGYPGIDASLCSQFSVVGKLVIVAMMIRGRHRGLPYGLDRAILLPKEKQFGPELDPEELPMVRSATAASGGANVRGRRLSIDRVANSKFLAQLLQPGPVISTPTYTVRRRANSMPQEDASDDPDLQVSPTSARIPQGWFLKRAKSTPNK